MSIEAQALGRLIKVIQEESENPSLQTNILNGKLKRIAAAVLEAQYWISPMQTYRDKLYAIWESNPHWTRERFLAYVQDDGVDDKDHWEIRCICLGDMNYRVENEGFYGWVALDGHALPVDFDVLDKLCRSLKTPLGYQAAAIIASVNVMVQGYRGQGTDEAFKALEEDLAILTQSYLNIHYRLLAEIEAKMREEVPVFQPKPKT